ncbi:hypothetical protein XENORESO_014872 [Xenotaenia resolanae]|uniref:DUF6729 domain-containing protein n=1 Tax=Xenotaenia resolanae TaxID=208358 RepID=A0ABV0VWW7_9TELE
MPEEDHQWVSTALFRVCAKGKLELQDHLQLWYFPPQPQHRPGFLPIPYCCGCRTGCGRFDSFAPTKPVSRPLSSGGLHRRVRQVLDTDRFYNLVTETLICSKCRWSYLSWNREILEQLDTVHRSEFRVILTCRYVAAFV